MAICYSGSNTNTDSGLSVFGCGEMLSCFWIICRRRRAESHSTSTADRLKTDGVPRGQSPRLLSDVAVTKFNSGTIGIN